MCKSNSGAAVILHEMRPVRMTEAHQSMHLAELVCSNSLRSDDWLSNAVGLLHEEMRRAGSLIMQSADRNKVPAGGALAVDRESFSEFIERQTRCTSPCKGEVGERSERGGGSSEAVPFDPHPIAGRFATDDRPPPCRGRLRRGCAGQSPDQVRGRA